MTDLSLPRGIPMWLTAELTYRCPLKCSWCSNPLDYGKYAAAELETEEWKRILGEARALGAVQLGFSGGEPMLRDDLEVLVDHADKLGYYTNLITSGIGLTEARLDALIGAGLKQVQLSLQAARPELTDHLVDARAHGIKDAAARLVKSRGLPMVLNVPLFRQNLGEIDALLTWAAELGIEYVELANIQYYNWALMNRDELMPTLEALREAEQVVERWRAAGDRGEHGMTIYFVIPDYYEGRPKACMNGWGNIHLTIAPDGVPMPCVEARVLPGLEFASLREHSLDWIWNDSPLFKRFRGFDWMSPTCRECPDKEKDFGGCRCQAFLLTGDATATDPACSRSPDHHLVREATARVSRPIHFHMPLVKRATSAVIAEASEVTQ